MLLHSFQQLLRFRIVDTFDLLVIEEILLFALMIHDLEASCVQFIFVFRAADIVYGDLLWHCWPEVRFRLTDIARSRRGTIFVVLVVIQGCGNVARLVALGLLRRNQGCRLVESASWEAGGMLYVCGSHNARFCDLDSTMEEAMRLIYRRQPRTDICNR